MRLVAGTFVSTVRSELKRRLPNTQLLAASFATTTYCTIPSYLLLSRAHAARPEITAEGLQGRGIWLARRLYPARRGCTAPSEPNGDRGGGRAAALDQAAVSTRSGASLWKT